MKHPKLFLLAAVLLTAALPSAAQEIKTACGESTYEVSKNTPRMVAMRIALTKARAQALANAFGTSTTQTDSLTAQNGEEEADRFVSSMTTVNVTGEWIANEGAPEYTFETDEEKGTLRVTCRICGKVRKRASDGPAIHVASDDTIP